MSQPVALTSIAICQIILTVALTIAAIGLLVAVFLIKNMLSRKIDEALAKVQPVMDQAKSIADQAKQTADNASQTVDRILSRAEDTAGKVSDKVESVSEKVEASVNPQIVTIAGIVGTAAKCAQIYSDVQRTRQGHNGGSKKAAPDSDSCNP